MFLVGLKGEGNDEGIAFAYKILQKKKTDNAFLMEENYYINTTCWKLNFKERGEGKGSLHSTKMGSYSPGTVEKLCFKTVKFSNNIN